MAKSYIRPSAPQDAPALAALLAKAGLRPNSGPEEMHWKYWLERPDRPGPRSFVLTRDSEILAHAAAVPGVCRWGDRRISVLHAIDWAALPGAAGTGSSLMKHLGKSADALLAIGGSAQTLQLLPHLGFRPAGTATCYVRPLHPLRILTPSAHPTWKLLPRLARSVLWTLQAQSGGIDGWGVRQISPEELPRIAAVLPVPTHDMAVFERCADLFRYALTCPIVSMQLYAVEKAGRTRGYFLLAFAARQARLADCWVDSEDPVDWRALIQCAVREAKRHPRAAELAAWASDPMLSRCLSECGFHARGRLPVLLLSPQNPVLTPATLRVQMLDNDTAYRHTGRNEFWA
jgi:hypothetical protein